MTPQRGRSAFRALLLRDVLARRSVLLAKAKRPLGDLNVIAKVTFGGVLHLRDDEAKRTYKGPLFEALPGDLIISKIRVGQGSFCVIGNEMDHVAVSPEYPVYVPDTGKLSAEYLSLLLRTPMFLQSLTGSSSGNTTKRRIRPTFFEGLKIPLPPLAEQQALVAAYRAAMARAAADEAAAGTLEIQAAAAFAEALGLAPPAPLPDRPVFIAAFRDLDRWSHEAVLRRSTGGEAHETTFPSVRLGDVIADLQNGWSPKCHDRPAQGDEWGVLKVSAASNGTYRAIENKGLPQALKPRPNYEVQPGDVLITRASGAASLVGIPAFVDATPARLMLSDKLFRVVFRSESRIDPEFLAAALKQTAVRGQIFGEFSTESGMMKNISKPALLALTFPLPPLETQRSLVAALAKARTRAAALRSAAVTARTKARVEFEAAVYE